MRRSIEKYLVSWKNSAHRLPLLMRGARQVGKSYTIEKFGKEWFENCVTANFDLYPKFASCFAGSLEPKEVCAAISVMAAQEIIPGKTLLFLDEIQQCPRAIGALRYFYEKMPALHVIGAGSLLEFAMSADEVRMPVGRIQYLFMYPLTFAEYIEASGHTPALRAVSDHEPLASYTEAEHEHLLSLLKSYLVIGGMPAVVREYLAAGNMVLCNRMQASIAQTYRDDFGKYASRARIAHLQNVFAAVPKMVGRKFKYTSVDTTVHSREIKTALELLEKAGVVYRVKQTSGSGLPLEAGASERNFKVVFLDVGLMQHLCGLTGELLGADDILAVHAGAVAEQFAGQELVAHTDPFMRPGLYYWAREARTSSAEVDYLVPSGSKVLPLEVKAGKGGTLRSLRLFFQEYASPLGIRVSQHNLSYDGRILSMPLYALQGLDRTLQAVLQGPHA
ncbi:MAG: ATP-binding protein [Chitinispirillaceae bacterium]|nr:ATP-binding protein [Chitinispirillaceae bacterium]